MILFSLPFSKIELFLFILVRISGIFITTPFLGSRTLPARTKIGLALILSFLIYCRLQDELFFLPDSLITFFLILFKELIIGFIIGFSLRLVFSGVQLAGQLVGFQMGFAIVNVFDPLAGGQVSIISRWQFLLAILIFLSLDVHHIIIYALMDSFFLVPICEVNFSQPLFKEIFTMGSSIFTSAIKIGAPIIAILLFTTVGLGLIARTVPQINIFIVAFPVKIAIGLIGLGISLPAFYYVLRLLLKNWHKEVYSLF